MIQPLPNLNNELVDFDEENPGRTAEIQRAVVGASNSICNPAAAFCRIRASCSPNGKLAADESLFPPCSFRNAISSIGGPGFEGFFNACILRRPLAEYQPGYFGDVTLMWADEKYKDHRLDAALNTNVRFFARDLGVETSLPSRRFER